MRLLSMCIEVAVVALCLPFYAITAPLFLLHERRIAERLRARRCPRCGAGFENIGRKDISRVGAMLRLAPGTRILWDRLPCYGLTCPTCGREVCFDRHLRVTACDRTDAIVRTR